MEFVSENQMFFFLFGFSAAGFFVMGWYVVRLRKKIALLFGGGGRDEGDVMKNVVKRLYDAEERIKDMDPRLDAAEAIAKVSVSKVGFLRFNPFQDTGGDNSFSAAFLDQEDSGVIITSLYTRAGVRVYAKRIIRGASLHHLSEEEKRAIEEAMRK